VKEMGGSTHPLEYKARFISNANTRSNTQLDTHTPTSSSGRLKNSLFLVVVFLLLPPIGSAILSSNLYKIIKCLNDSGLRRSGSIQNTGSS